MFVHADPGRDTSTALRSWAAAHRELWGALQRRDCAVEIVLVAQTMREIDGAHRVIRGWAQPSRSDEPDAETAEELARIERAIIEEVHVLEDYGGLQAAMKRSIVLEKQARRRPRRAWVDRTATWQTVRLRGVRYR